MFERAEAIKRSRSGSFEWLKNPQPSNPYWKQQSPAQAYQAEQVCQIGGLNLRTCKRQKGNQALPKDQLPQTR